MMVEDFSLVFLNESVAVDVREDARERVSSSHLDEPSTNESLDDGTESVR